MNYLKVRFNGTREEFEKAKDWYENADIVYDIQYNAGCGYHLITIFKRPEGISDYELACKIDGFFYKVINRGGNLECWYD